MRQVYARAALGMSVEATALELGIGKTSVPTYRQRAHQRQRRHEPFRAVCARGSRNALLRRLLLDTCICRAP